MLENRKFLVDDRLGVECVDFEVPEGEVIAFGDDHQRRGVVHPTHERHDVVVEEEIDRFDGASIPIWRCPPLRERIDPRGGDVKIFIDPKRL